MIHCLPTQITVTDIQRERDKALWAQRDLEQSLTATLEAKRNLEKHVERLKIENQMLMEVTGAQTEGIVSCSKENEKIRHYLTEAMGHEACEDCDTAQLVAILISQRDNAKSAETGFKRRCIEWRALAQEMTPGGSEFMTPDAVRAYYRKFKDDAHASKKENAILRAKYDEARAELLRSTAGNRAPL